jgi:hypothetical protein
MLTTRLDCQRFSTKRLDYQRFNITRSLITANTTVIITASTALITPMDEVGIDKAVAAITDVEALATAEEALIEDLVEVNSGMEPDIDKLYNSIFNDIVP